MMKYQFSVGKGLRNNTPENKECESFEDLFKMVVNLSHKNKNPIKGGSQKDNDSIKKEGYWIGAPFSGRRAKHNALARQFVILDVDRCPKENRSQVKDYCKRWKSFVYSSFSSTDENPKFRIVVDASRSILPEEMETVTRYLSNDLVQFLLPHIEGAQSADCFKVYRKTDTVDPKTGGATEMLFEVDSRTGEQSRIFLMPPQCFTNSAELFADGEPLNVDLALTMAPKVAKKRGSKTLPQTTEGVSSSFVDLGSDPILSILKDRGLLGKEMNAGSGKWSCKCPFHEDHSTPYGGEDDSSCVFFETGAKGDDGESTGIGHFVCLHESCSHREPFEFFKKIGVPYQDYLIYAKGNTAERFTSVNTGVTYFSEHGVIKAQIEKDGNTNTHTVADSFTVKALSTNKDGENPILWIEIFNSLTGQVTVEPLPRDELFSSNTGDYVVKRLVQRGLNPRKLRGGQGKNYLVDYLQSFPMFTVPKKVSVDRVGWFELPSHLNVRGSRQVFVTPNCSFGDNVDNVLYIGERAVSLKLSSKGSVEDWKEKVASFGAISSRVRFAISCAFSAPCLKLVGLEGGAFNICGSSSKGKTTAQKAAASVYSNPDTEIKSWDSTSTAIEVIANGHNDSLLCLDEGGTADPRNLTQTIYRLTGGQPKGRGMIDGTRGGAIGAREAPPPWHLITLSTSELPLSDLMRTITNKDATAGQRVRLIDVSAVVNPKKPENGIFETTGDYTSTKEAASALTENVTQVFGAVGIEWLKHLTTDTQTCIDKIRAYREQFVTVFDRQSTLTLSTQGRRALDRFAIAAAAGCLATELNLTGWTIEGVLIDLVSCAIESLQPFEKDREIMDAISKLARMVTVNETDFWRIDDLKLERPYPNNCRGLIFAPRSDWRPLVSEVEKGLENRSRAVLIEKNLFRETVAPLAINSATAQLEQLGVLKVAGHYKGKRPRQSQFEVTGHKFTGVILLIDKLIDLAE